MSNLLLFTLAALPAAPLVPLPTEPSLTLAGDTSGDGDWNTVQISGDFARLRVTGGSGSVGTWYAIRGYAYIDPTAAPAYFAQYDENDQDGLEEAAFLTRPSEIQIQAWLTTTDFDADFPNMAWWWLGEETLEDFLTDPVGPDPDETVLTDRWRAIYTPPPFGSPSEIWKEYFRWSSETKGWWQRASSSDPKGWELVSLAELLIFDQMATPDPTWLTSAAYDAAIEAEILRVDLQVIGLQDGSGVPPDFPAEQDDSGTENPPLINWPNGPTPKLKISTVLTANLMSAVPGPPEPAWADAVSSAAEYDAPIGVPVGFRIVGRRGNTVGFFRDPYGLIYSKGIGAEGPGHGEVVFMGAGVVTGDHVLIGMRVGNQQSVAFDPGDYITFAVHP